jgi:hypothetical protein
MKVRPRPVRVMTGAVLFRTQPAAGLHARSPRNGDSKVRAGIPAVRAETSPIMGDPRKRGGYWWVRYCRAGQRYAEGSGSDKRGVAVDLSGSRGGAIMNDGGSRPTMP